MAPGPYPGVPVPVALASERAGLGDPTNRHGSVGLRNDLPARRASIAAEVPPNHRGRSGQPTASRLACPRIVKDHVPTGRHEPAPGRPVQLAPLLGMITIDEIGRAHV